MNQFEALCKLASDENWCWKLFCGTCGHTHFRYAFSELTAGKSPTDENWLIHRKITKYSDILGKLPYSYTEQQKEKVLHICVNANISSIAATCIFPDWLGYLGLVLEHMRCSSNSYRMLSTCWASQLADLVYPESPIHSRLQDISEGGGVLNISDLEDCESNMLHKHKALI